MQTPSDINNDDAGRHRQFKFHGSLLLEHIRAVPPLINKFCDAFFMDKPENIMHGSATLRGKLIHKRIYQVKRCYVSKNMALLSEFVNIIHAPGVFTGSAK